MKRYDYRQDYSKMTVNELRDCLKSLIDRMLNSIAALDNRSADDCIRRISYVESKIKKLEAKNAKRRHTK